MSELERAARRAVAMDRLRRRHREPSRRERRLLARNEVTRRVSARRWINAPK